MFVVETRGVRLNASEDTEYKQYIFDICAEHARTADRAEVVPAMWHKAIRFEVMDKDQRQVRLNGMLFPKTA